MSIAFAVGHPERVTHLILLAKACGPGAVCSDEDADEIGLGLGRPAFRQLFTSSMIPEATKEQADAFNELQRLSASPECAVRYIETVSDFDVRHLLPKVRAPTLILGD